jgi:hypothetical protein
LTKITLASANRALSASSTFKYAGFLGDLRL